MHTQLRAVQRNQFGALGRALLSTALVAMLVAPARAATKAASKAAVGAVSRPAPRLTLLTPARGSSGTRVTLVGKHLGTARGSVLFGGTVTILRWSDTSVTAVLKAPRPAQCPVRIRRADGQASNALLFDLR
jgi:hypothetical protein